MKRRLFSFASPVGTFTIRPAPDDKVALFVDGRKLESYRSARAAADAVADRETGFEPWDSDDATVPPRSLDRWKRESGLTEGSRPPRPAPDFA